MTDLHTRVREWIDSDPDPTSQQELRALLDAEDDHELAKRFGAPLEFGTAGIRGVVGGGPSRMNRAVVIRTTAGLAQWLTDKGEEGPVVVAYDARPSSRAFAEDTIGVLAAAGFEVHYFPDVAPTPLAAFAAKDLGASAAVVVTASHNPPADNGYKVYGPNAAQIVAPTDREISGRIEACGPAVDVPRVVDAMSIGGRLIKEMSVDVADRYWDEVNASRPHPEQSDLTVVYTPIHGVGGEMVSQLFARAGHTGLVEVDDQARPDGTFPTVAFPNPEEPGALDLAIVKGQSVDADLIIANDPDADRLAVVLPVEEGWRPLSGNEIGVLLGDYVINNWARPEPPIVINSIVSSPMLSLIAASRGALHTETLTGFKWIVSAGLAMEQDGVGRFAFGYEEALGYTIGPTVRDKDGMSAALVFTDLVAGLRRQGMTVLDQLESLWRQAGLWVSTQRSIVKAGPEGQEAIANAVEVLGDDPPSAIGEHEVTGVEDFRVGAEDRPAWLGAQNLIKLTLGETGRILVRPSGTEPKLKIYVDLAGELEGDVERQRGFLLATADELARHTEKSLYLG